LAHVRWLETFSFHLRHHALTQVGGIVASGLHLGHHLRHDPGKRFGRNSYDNSTDDGPHDHSDKILARFRTVLRHSETFLSFS
jgi:hypothetical protein